MTNEELSKLDFNLATMNMLVTTTAMLKTVLQNQMTIMEALNIQGNSSVVQNTNRLLQTNLAAVDFDLKNKIPETFYINYPKN